MLKYTSATNGFAVPDIAAAEHFYGQVLGIEIRAENGLLHLRLGNGNETLIYPKPDHSPATYTILNFVVADINAAIDSLAAEGITMQKYGGQTATQTDARGIFRYGPLQQAWFTDPAGNILSVLQLD